MTRKKNCVECRHCEMRIGPKKGLRHYCVRKKRGLPSNLASRPACAKFELPNLSIHWGP